jgi:hypothetical protein
VQTAFIAYGLFEVSGVVFEVGSLRDAEDLVRERLYYGQTYQGTQGCAYEEDGV